MYLLLFTYRKSYMGFLMAPLTSTFSDLERLNSRSCIFRMAITHKILRIFMHLPHVGFLISPLPLTSSDLERSNSKSHIVWMAISYKIRQIGIYLLLFTYRKSYMGFLMAPSTSTFSDLERLNSTACIFWMAITHKILRIFIYLPYEGFLIGPSGHMFHWLLMFMSFIHFITQSVYIIRSYMVSALSHLF